MTADTEAARVADLHSLAARAEAAEGPDRELDAAISVAVADGCGIRWHDLRLFAFATGKSPPLYTASLDAALTLASDFTEVQLWNLWNEALCQCSKAEASLRDDLARFVAAAALRARATQGENDAL
jgi:hypothetical protein